MQILKRKNKVIVILFLFTIFFSYAAYLIFNPNIINIQADKTPYKVKIAQEKEDLASKYIYSHIFKKSNNASKSAEKKPEQQQGILSDSQIKSEEFKNQIYKINESVMQNKSIDLFEVSCSDINIFDFEEQNSASSDKISNPQKNKIQINHSYRSEYVVDVDYALSLIEAEQKAKNLSFQHQNIIDKRNFLVRRSKIKDRVVFIIFVKNFNSLQDARNLCKKISRNNQNCIVTKINEMPN